MVSRGLRWRFHSNSQMYPLCNVRAAIQAGQEIPTQGHLRRVGARFHGSVYSHCQRICALGEPHLVAPHRHHLVIVPAFLMDPDRTGAELSPPFLPRLMRKSLVRVQLKAVLRGSPMFALPHCLIWHEEQIDSDLLKEAPTRRLSENKHQRLCSDLYSGYLTRSRRV